MTAFSTSVTQFFNVSGCLGHQLDICLQPIFLDGDRIPEIVSCAAPRSDQAMSIIYSSDAFIGLRSHIIHNRYCERVCQSRDYERLVNNTTLLFGY
jgi:hypothetical protein